MKKADKCKKFRLWNQESTGNVVLISASLVVKLDLLILTPEGKEQREEMTLTKTRIGALTTPIRAHLHLGFDDNDC